MVHAGDFTFVGDIRERFETLDGMNKKAYGTEASLIGSPYDTLLVSRIQLGFVYRLSPNIKFTAEGYYASVYGWSLDYNDFKMISGNEVYWMDPQEDLDFVALNLEVKNLAGIQGLSGQIGRESNRYGDKRILGPGSWGNSYGWLWDLAKVSYRFDGNFVDLFYGETKDKDKRRLSLFRKHVYEGAGIYSHFKTAENGAVEPFIVYKNGLYTGTGNGQNTEKSYTFGFRAYDTDLFGFNYDLTYAKADGTIKIKDYDAYGYAAKVGYRFKMLTWMPNVVIGQIYASGDDDPGDNTVKTFRTPFGGTDGSLYGRMDIMKWSNLVENVVELHMYPAEKMHLKLSWHDFSLANANDAWTYYKKYNKNGNHERELGQEYDIEYKWDYAKDLEFQVIYAYFDAGAFVTKNVSDNDAQRLFLQVEYSFKE
ncbi:hypothetical protein YH65_06360 [Sulfurovum lithotrophicum]|uniref:Alginate export domain-containing protein n=1 Tax=Sulfurovum lithotrophicum TaxID=206403 RepID=A0A7U4RQS8_9BACT|nr:alginate export family protein [Sulfurovum lithotrophicum]AKF25057.1 hypothetical protein YH65_06360 [Sulfurovum lithotrophicum]